MVSAYVSLLVPKQLQGNEDGFLQGTITSSASSAGDRREYLIVVTQADSSYEGSLGCINNEARMNITFGFKTVWFTLRTHSNIVLTSFSILGQDINLREVKLIIYDLKEIYQSELISRKYPCRREKDYSIDIVPYLVYSVKNEMHSKRMESFLIIIVKVLSFFLAILWIPKIVFEALNFMMHQVNYCSSFLKQILLRISQIKKIQEVVNSDRSSLIYGRLLTMIAVDIVSGLCIACIISTYASVADIYSSFCDWTKLLADTVLWLLDWLSGAPAGLKLNQPLTQAFSSFFSYHVRLWILYLEMADPVLRGMAWVLVWVGMCGASVQVSILSDLLNLGTLHLHCFYIYGARLYNLQTSLLGSQWRAFRGHKWNPLKQRMDTYDVGNVVSLRKVLTAVVFTLVVFLLPTTAIYYLVFVSLKICLKLTGDILAVIVWAVNINPLYLILLSITDSNKLKGDIYFSIQRNGKHGEQDGYLKSCSELPVQLNLRTWPTSLSHMMTETIANIFPPRPEFKWSFILSSIMFGEQLL